MSFVTAGYTDLCQRQPLTFAAISHQKVLTAILQKSTDIKTKTQQQNFTRSYSVSFITCNLYSNSQTFNVYVYVSFHIRYETVDPQE